MPPDLLSTWLSTLALCVQTWHQGICAFLSLGIFIVMTQFANGTVVHMGQKRRAILGCSKVSVAPNPVLMLGVWCSFQGELWHRALIYLVTAWGFNAFSVSGERASYGGGERSYGEINIFISLGHWQFVAMIRGITAQGEPVGQNLMYNTYTSENWHRDLLLVLKKQRWVGSTETLSLQKYVDNL